MISKNSDFKFMQVTKNSFAENTQSFNFSRNTDRTPRFNQPISKNGDSSISPERETETDGKPTQKYDPNEWDHGKKITYHFIELIEPESETDTESENENADRSRESSENSSDGEQRNQNSDRSYSDSYTESSDEEEPEFNDFVPIKYISEGAFGQVSALVPIFLYPHSLLSRGHQYLQVYLVKNRLNGRFYAMKRIRKEKILNIDDLIHTLQEKRVIVYFCFLDLLTYIIDNGAQQKQSLPAEDEVQFPKQHKNLLHHGLRKWRKHL